MFLRTSVVLCKLLQIVRHTTHILYTQLWLQQLWSWTISMSMSPAYTHTTQPLDLQPTTTLHTAQQQSQCVVTQPHTVTQPQLPTSHSLATPLHSHQPIPATYPWLLESSGTQPQRIQYVGLPIPMPGDRKSVV